MYEKINFFKTLKGRYLLLGGPTNIIFGQFLDNKVHFINMQMRYFGQNKVKVLKTLTLKVA